MNTQQMYDILDTAFKTLYNNMDKDGLHFEKQILQPNKIRLKPKEIDKLWDVLLATGLADSIIGFGKEGKLEITPAGIQMMTRYGSYKNFLIAQQSNSHPQPQQLTIQLVNQEDKNTDKPAALPPAKPKKTTPARKKSKQSK